MKGEDDIFYLKLVRSQYGPLMEDWLNALNA